MGLAQTETNKNIDKFTGDLLSRLAFLENRIAQLEADEGLAPTSIAILEDQKSAGTAGGQATSGSWYTRTLNTEVSDPGGIVTLASNQFELQPGTYLIRASSPAYKVYQNKIRLRNITTGSTTKVGSSEHSDNGDFVTSRSHLSALVTLTVATTFEIQQRVSFTVAVYGLGEASGAWGEVEVYTQVEIIKFN